MSIEEIRERICQDYCKYTEQYLSCYKEPDEATEKLLSDMCEYCPLGGLDEAIHEMHK